MNNARPDFGETLQDWQADPSNWAAGALFQPKSLGTTLGGRRARRTHRFVAFALTAIATAAGTIAMMALARALHLLA